MMYYTNSASVEFCWPFKTSVGFSSSRPTVLYKVWVKRGRFLKFHY